MKEKTTKNKQIKKLNETTECKWWKLDNAGLIFPAVACKKIPKVFRLSVYLTKKVNKEALQQATDLVMERYPQFNVRLKCGLFWTYFEELPTTPKVVEEDDYPCKAFSFRKGHLVRVLYYKNKISFECFHGLADGGGAFTFFGALIKAYFEKLSEGKIVFDELHSLPIKEESEDAFARYADFKEFSKREGGKAYQIKGTPLPINRLNIDIVSLDAEKLKQVAKQNGASITEFLVANLMLSIEKQRKFYKSKKKVKVLIPFDLRRRMPTKTLRNFVLSKLIEFKGESFEEIVLNIRNEMAKVDERFALNFMNTNVRDQRLACVKFIPSVIKNFILKICYLIFGESTATITFSNMGVIKMPEEIANNIVDVEGVASREALNTYFVGCMTCGNKLNVCFSSKIFEKEIIRNFVLNLNEYGLEAKLRSNSK